MSRLLMDIMSFAQETVAATGLDVADVLDQGKSGVSQVAYPLWLEGILNGLMDLGLHILKAGLAAIIGWYIVKFLAKWIRAALNKSRLDDGIAGFLASVIHMSMKIILALTVIGFLGIPMSSIVALVGSAGLAIGLALQGCLTNFAGGVLILVLKPFKVGDYIIADSIGNEGTVTSIDVIYTKLLTADNRAITIPNGALSNSTLINVTREQFRRLDFMVSIDYAEDIDRVKDVLMKVGLDNSYVLKDRDCSVFVNSFDPSSVSVGLRFWVKTEQYWEAKWYIQERIKKTFDAHHISIPFDQLDVHLVEK